MESLPYEEARKVFKANFWGASNVTKEVIRMFRKVNKPIGCRILLRWGYAASKHALEGFSESITQELDPAWNIKVTTFELGPFRTRIFADNLQPGPQHPVYTNPELAGSKSREGVISSLPDGDAEQAVAAIEKVTRLDEPPLRPSLADYATDATHAPRIT